MQLVSARRTLANGHAGFNVEAHIGALAGAETVVAGGGDHCRIIGAQRWRRAQHWQLGEPLDTPQQRAIGGHAAAQSQAGRAKLSRCAGRLGRQDIDDRGLKTRRQIGDW